MMKWLGICVLAIASLNGADRSWESCKVYTLAQQHTAEGWCSREKAAKMMDLIHEVRPDVCVEIGVFGGASIYPTAKALRYLHKGIVYAIDPWAKGDCQAGYDPEDPNYIWWSSIDLEKIYQGFLKLLARHQLQPFCKPLRMTSEEALAQFPDHSIDILHIDGNHTEEIAFFDATMWLPKVKSGGYIWFDDVNWPSTARAREYLQEHCDWIDEVKSEGGECWLLKKF